MVNGILEGEVCIVCVSRLCVDRVDGTGGEDCALEQRVRGQPIGSVHSGARDLADGEDSVDARATIAIRGHPAHEVVGGGSDGDEVPGQIETVSGQTGGDARERRLHIRDGPRIEEARASVLSRLATVQGECDDITRSELGAIIDVSHEPVAVLVEDESAGPADGLGDEETGTWKGGGVELEELEIGDLSIGANGSGQTVSGGSCRVRRVCEELPDTAGGQHDRISSQGLDAAFAEHGDSGAQLLRQSGADRPTGRITSGM